MKQSNTRQAGFILGVVAATGFVVVGTTQHLGARAVADSVAAQPPSGFVASSRPNVWVRQVPSSAPMVGGGAQVYVKPGGALPPLPSAMRASSTAGMTSKISRITRQADGMEVYRVSPEDFAVSRVELTPGGKGQAPQLRFNCRDGEGQTLSGPWEAAAGHQGHRHAR